MVHLFISHKTIIFTQIIIHKKKYTSKSQLCLSNLNILSGDNFKLKGIPLHSYLLIELFAI